MTPLEGIHVLTLAPNLPGPVAVARLHRLGATVVKIEPPAGDALARACPAWYNLLCDGQTVVTLDLKRADDRERLAAHLGHADLLITATRPAALRRLGLDWCWFIVVTLLLLLAGGPAAIAIWLPYIKLMEGLPK